MNDINKTIKHFESLQKRYTTQHNGQMCERVADALEALYRFKNQEDYFNKMFGTAAVKEFADLVVKNICEKVTPIPQQKYLINMCIQEIENTKKEMMGEG